MSTPASSASTSTTTTTCTSSHDHPTTTTNVEQHPVTRSETQPQQQQQQQQHGYQYKKLGDLMDEIDDLLGKKRMKLQQKASQQVHGLMEQVSKLYHEIRSLANQQNPDPSIIQSKQQQLNEIEQHAVQGVYGVQAQICPLDQPGQPIHHIRVEAIPPGQASIRSLIEKSHQLLTRVMDRVEETVSSMAAATAATSAASSSISVQIGGKEAGHIHAQPTVNVTVTTTEGGKPKQEQKEEIPHIARGARTAEGSSAPITSQGPGAGISGH